MNEPAGQSDNSVGDYAFTIKPHYGMLNVIMAEEPVDMILDSGASCNIINSTVAAKHREQGEIFEQYRRNIYPYGSAPIVARNVATCDIRVGNNSTVAEFLVIPGNCQPLLGKSTAQKLDALKLGINYYEHSEDSTVDNVMSQYPGVASGVGRLKNVAVKLNIDQSTTPAARKNSRVPFQLRHKVEKEIQKFEQQDVIEKVIGPTEWVSSRQNRRIQKKSDYA